MRGDSSTRHNDRYNGRRPVIRQRECESTRHLMVHSAAPGWPIRSGLTAILRCQLPAPSKYRSVAPCSDRSCGSYPQKRQCKNAIALSHYPQLIRVQLVRPGVTPQRAVAIAGGAIAMCHCGGCCGGSEGHVPAMADQLPVSPAGSVAVTCGFTG